MLFDRRQHHRRPKISRCLLAAAPQLRRWLGRVLEQIEHAQAVALRKLQTLRSLDDPLGRRHHGAQDETRQVLVLESRGTRQKRLFPRLDAQLDAAAFGKGGAMVVSSELCCICNVRNETVQDLRAGVNSALCARNRAQGLGYPYAVTLLRAAAGMSRARPARLQHGDRLRLLRQVPASQSDWLQRRAERAWRLVVLNRWGNVCPSCFDAEAEKAGVRYSFVTVDAISWSDRPVPRSWGKRKR